MKSFFTSFFASLTALIVVIFGSGLVLAVIVAAVVALGQKKPVAVPPGAYLVFDLAANIQDAPAQLDGLAEIMESFGRNHRSVLQLRSLTRALQAAAKDEAIAGLYLTGSLQPAGYGTGYAALAEVRAAIAEFKASGKPVKAYLNYADTRDFYLASAASEIVLDPYGVVVMPGLASQPMFFTGALEKLGVGVQVTRVGKYKSAVEPYTRKEMSSESREQTQQLLNDLWGTLTTAIEKDRRLETGALQKAVDAQGFLRPEVAKKLKLIDRIAYHDEVLTELKAATGRAGLNQNFSQVALRDYAKLVTAGGLVAKRQPGGRVELKASGRGKIAIVYAEGEIVDGQGLDEDNVYGEKTARLLRQIRQDKNIKALVLRVNSPGGSVSASEAIHRELHLCGQQMPIIVSMGTVAASGGYWISTEAERIFAEPTTITGSIGVFGLFLNFQGLATDKFGLNFATVKTGKFADLATVTRPKTEEELALFQANVDWVYDQFLRKVSAARKLDRRVVEEIAQGRVWSGRAALQLGLVDEMGGLAAAVNYAAQKVKLGEDFRVVEYPRAKPLSEALSEVLEGKHHEQTWAGPVGTLMQKVMAEFQALIRFNDPRGLYARMPVELYLP
jgi:protease-4